MKKVLTLIFMAGMVLNAAAQLSDGFYRIKNNTTGRYIVMYDPYVVVNKATGTVGLTALQTISSFNTVSSHMGSIWYMKDLGESKYDLFCQHSSLGANSGGFYPTLFLNGSLYRIYGEYSGFAKYLSDVDNYDTGGGNVSVNGQNINWEFLPINDDNYIGIKPETDADGYYWATFMSGFPFKLGSGMKAYYVNSINDHGFAMKEMGDEIPAKTPVLLRLNGSNPSDNKITLMKNSNASAPSDNKMYGTWYSSNLGGKHESYNVKCESYNRVLGKSGGRLAFVKGSGVIEHNRGYIDVSTNADDAIIEASSGINSIENDSDIEDGIYTLTGQKVPEGTTPRSGIYIKNGKKMVIK